MLPPLFWNVLCRGNGLKDTQRKGKKEWEQSSPLACSRLPPALTRLTLRLGMQEKWRTNSKPEPPACRHPVPVLMARCAKLINAAWSVEPPLPNTWWRQAQKMTRSPECAIRTGFLACGNYSSHLRQLWACSRWTRGLYKIHWQWTTPTVPFFSWVKNNMLVEAEAAAC